LDSVYGASFIWSLVVKQCRRIHSVRLFASDGDAGGITEIDMSRFVSRNSGSLTSFDHWMDEETQDNAVLTRALAGCPLLKFARPGVALWTEKSRSAALQLVRACSQLSTLWLSLSDHDHDIDHVHELLLAVQASAGALLGRAHMCHLQYLVFQAAL
jgi:hypothetical protein